MKTTGVKTNTRNLLNTCLLVISFISSSVVLVVLRHHCSYPNLLPAHKQEVAHLVVASSNDKTTTHHQLAAAAAAAAAPSPSDSDDDDDDIKLSEVLSRAAMEDNRTVILTITNEAWTAPGSLTELFLESFRTGVNTEPLLKHLLIVTVDAGAWEWCRRVHGLCYALDVGRTDFTLEQAYMERHYVELMWRRIRLQARVLELGYSFLLTDVDIVWFRNPLLRVPVAADLAMACDRFRGANPYDLRKDVNAGLVYARASARTVEFYREWYAARKLFPGKKTQDVFKKIKDELTPRLGVTLQFVDTAYFGTFCDRQWEPRNYNKLCTFHASCLIGLDTKVHRLRLIHNEWKRFKATASIKATASNNGTTPITY